MKKIIMGLAVFSAALAVNATQATWGPFYGSYVDSKGDEFTSGSALFYVLAGDASTAITFDSATGVWNLNGATPLDRSGYDAIEGGWGSIEYKETGVALNTSDPSNMQYFQILITEKTGITSIDGYEGAYVDFVRQGSRGVVEPSGPTYGVIADISADIGKDDWKTASAVPEPTSGLLLLLGVAGLALKRRRA